MQASRSRSLHGSNEDSDEVGGGASGSEVAGGTPVGLDGGDVGGDGLFVEEVVLGSLGDEGLGLLEDGGPLLDLLDVVTHVGAGSNIELEVVNHLFELLHGSEDVESFDVLEGSLGVGHERGDTSVAGLHLGEVVVTNHAVHETSGEIGEGQKVHADNGLVDFSGLLDGAYSDVKEVGGSLAGSVVLSSRPVGLDGGDISIDSLLVEDH